MTGENCSVCSSTSVVSSVASINIMNYAVVFFSAMFCCSVIALMHITADRGGEDVLTAFLI